MYKVTLMEGLLEKGSFEFLNMIDAANFAEIALASTTAAEFSVSICLVDLSKVNIQQEKA